MEMRIKARIEAALELAGLGKNGLQVSYLAEGAWHEAYLISTTETGPLVVRFPKPFSYGKPFVYNERELRAEYGGRGLYYRLANGVIEGICPPYYSYYVSPELSFTIETYSGPVMSLAAADEAEAARWGMQCGRFFRKMDRTSVELEGFGLLDWKDGKLAGDRQQDFRALGRGDGGLLGVVGTAAACGIWQRSRGREANLGRDRPVPLAACDWVKLNEPGRIAGKSHCLRSRGPLDRSGADRL
ncbi:hypothetical protein [Paenibacillus tianmuensis]|uniref:hypothetical protein n=1 Tax=Paenibacillus tianmuensis TaxID=624147 RepID=UPI000AAC0FCB|nr:hypothetical protein [Paenibacillus tianmuensis]